MASPFPFIDSKFRIPEGLETGEIHLRMLTINDVVKDYDAVMSIADELKNIWPVYSKTSPRILPCADAGLVIPSRAAIVGATSTG